MEERGRYSYTKGPMRLTVPQLVAWLVAGLQGAAVRDVSALLATGAGNGVGPRGYRLLDGFWRAIPRHAEIDAATGNPWPAGAGARQTPPS